MESEFYEEEDIRDWEMDTPLPVINYLRNLQQFPESKIKTSNGLGPIGTDTISPRSTDFKLPKISKQMHHKMSFAQPNQPQKHHQSV